jgi:CubicO group peptidase (beta-lactamase class C family)
MHISKSIVLALYLTAFTMAQDATAQNASVDGLDRPTVRTELGARIDRYLSALAVYGMSGSIVVAKDGQVIVHKSYGLADRSAGVALATDMPMLIGSLSKQFVAAAILKLEAQGRVRVTDTLGRFFEDVPDDKRTITIHQLLTHTAGLEYLPGGELFAPMERADVMRATLAVPLKSAPGAGFAYSNLGYTLIAGIIERVAGTRFEDYIRKELMAPAGMRHTGFETDTGAWRSRLTVHSYTGSADEGPASAFPIAPKLTGAGSVVTTVADLYRWELALNGSAVLPDSSRRKLFTPHVDAGGPARYAYGWNVITTVRGTKLLAHAGDIGGYNADFRRYVDEGLVVIFISNARAAGGGYREAVMNNVSLLVSGAPYAAAPDVVELDAHRLDTFTGRYRLSSGELVRLWRDGAHLLVGAERQEGIGLLSGAAPDDSASAAVYNERTLSIARDLASGDFTAFQRVLTPSLPFDEARDEIGRLLRSYADSLGPLRETVVLGTAVLSKTSARTYWRLVYERGSVMQEWSWKGGVITGLDGELESAMTTLLAPTSPTTASSFDPFTGRTISIAMADRGPRSIRITSGGRVVTAERVGGS